jgi:DNA-binding CsgD family transcriptional regulator/catechol 2,3-dioxygenase-like lactoylglutathione lyase family enzyme
MAGRPRGRPRHDDVLTPAEWRVLHWIRHGLTRAQIASLLSTSEWAVKYHVRNIRAKLDVPDQPALRQWAGRARSDQARREELPVGDHRVDGLGQVSLLVTDTDLATAFYRDTLGLTHLYSFGDLTFFDCAGVRLYLHRVGADQWHPGSVLYLRVPDIDASHRELAARGVPFAGAPHLVHRHTSGVEEWMAFFGDPDGNQLALMTQRA